VAAGVVHALMEFLCDSNNPSAFDVVAFVRDVIEKLPNLGQAICERLIQTLGKSSQVKCLEWRRLCRKRVGKSDRNARG